MRDWNFYVTGPAHRHLRAVKHIFWGPGPSKDFHDLTDARRTEWVAPILLGAAILIFGIWPSLVLDFIDLATPAYLELIPQELAVVP